MDLLPAVCATRAGFHSTAYAEAKDVETGWFTGFFIEFFTTPLLGNTVIRVYDPTNWDRSVEFVKWAEDGLGVGAQIVAAIRSFGMPKGGAA